MKPAQLNSILLRRDDGPVLFDLDYRAHIAAMEGRIKWLEDELWNALMEVDKLKMMPNPNLAFAFPRC